MSLQLAPRRRAILWLAPVLVSAVTLVACGQRGPLYLPTTPAAAQRASLPQTIWGGASGAAAAAAASAPVATPQALPQPVLPDLPDLQ